MRVSDAHAKAKCTCLSPVAVLVAELLNDQIGPAAVANVPLFEFADCISSAGPRDFGQVRTIVDAIVIERN